MPSRHLHTTGYKLHGSSFNLQLRGPGSLAINSQYRDRDDIDFDRAIASFTRVVLISSDTGVKLPDHEATASCL
nr:hypothetical protein CFP56_77970 [Quercus suber]